MTSPCLTADKVSKVFRKIHLEENYNFLQEDLQKLADAFVMAAEPAITAAEREKCVIFVQSLNIHVAQSLKGFKGEV
jgi:hypothetical protein